MGFEYSFYIIKENDYNNIRLAYYIDHDYNDDSDENEDLINLLEDKAVPFHYDDVFFGSSYVKFKSKFFITKYKNESISNEVYNAFSTFWYIGNCESKNIKLVIDYLTYIITTFTIDTKNETGIPFKLRYQGISDCPIHGYAHRCYGKELYKNCKCIHNDSFTSSIACQSCKDKGELCLKFETICWFKMLLTIFNACKDDEMIFRSNYS